MLTSGKNAPMIPFPKLPTSAIFLCRHHEVSPRPNGNDATNKESYSRCNTNIPWQLFRCKNFGAQEPTRNGGHGQNFFMYNEKGQTWRKSTRLGRVMLCGRVENVTNRQVELRGLNDEPYYFVTKTDESNLW